MGERTGPVSGHTRDIRRDIDRTQREMSHTIDEIQHRLSPHYMMERTKNSVREAGVRTSHTIVDRIRDNPIPAAMVGVGLWLLMRGSDRRDLMDMDAGYDSAYDWDDVRAPEERIYETRDRVTRAVDTAKEQASATVDSVREATSEALHSASARAHQLRTAARSRALRARSDAGALMRDNPMIAGVAALALGAIFGAMIPETERENEILGDARDRLIDRGKEMASEGIDRARGMAAAATNAASEAVKKEAKSGKTDVGQNVGLG